MEKSNASLVRSIYVHTDIFSDLQTNIHISTENLEPKEIPLTDQVEMISSLSYPRGFNPIEESLVELNTYVDEEK
jgi:hypothetical protein